MDSNIRNELSQKLKSMDESDVLDNIEIDMSLYTQLKPREPDDILPHYHFTFNYYHFDDITDECETIAVGWAEAIVLDEMLSNEYDLLELCDAESQDLLNGYTAIYDLDGYLLEPLEEYSPSPICYLSEFIIDEDFEPTQTGILEWLIKYLSNFSPVVVTLPVPSYKSIKNDIHYISRDFGEKKTKALRKFFSEYQFYPLRDTDYMYHIFDYSLD